MPDITCHSCGNTYTWSWDEAFCKFGFNDGDGQVMTEDVAEVLRAAGYIVRTEPWGLHNVTIASILKDGLELIPHDRISFGYDDPRRYLPSAMIRLLDLKLPDNGEAVS